MEASIAMDGGVYSHVWSKWRRVSGFNANFFVIDAKYIHKACPGEPHYICTVLTGIYGSGRSGLV
jgi:hypothetical protein